MDPLPDDIEFLEHHGVKGMKWGVRNEDRPTGRESGSSTNDKKQKSNVSNDDFLKAYFELQGKSYTPAEKAKNIAENKKKFLDKFDDGDSKKDDGESGFHLTKGQVAAIGVGAAFVGLYFYGKHLDKSINLELSKAYDILGNPPNPGSPVPADVFHTLTSGSIAQTWMGGNFIQPSSFDRPEFTLPVGHTFKRLSTRPEEVFKGAATYTTHSTNDFNRYLSQFRKEKVGAKKFYEVSFKTNEEIKVPNLNTALKTLKEVLIKDGVNATDEFVLESYQAMSGGKWDSHRATTFFSALKSKGYGAIVDEMDAGVIGDTPLVLFNRNTTPLTPKLLSNSDIKLAESSLVELFDRKLLAA